MKSYTSEPESHKKRDRECQRKAVQRDQFTFTLVEQDVTTPESIGEWIKINLRTGNLTPGEKLHEALETAVLIRDSQIPKKFAD